MAEVSEDEIKVDTTLGYVGRHCILHALTVIEAAISQVCLSVCDSVSVTVCLCPYTVSVYTQVDMCVCACCVLVCTCVFMHVCNIIVNLELTS